MPLTGGLLPEELNFGACCLTSLQADRWAAPTTSCTSLAVCVLCQPTARLGQSGTGRPRGTRWYTSPDDSGSVTSFLVLLSRWLDHGRLSPRDLVDVTQPLDARKGSEAVGFCALIAHTALMSATRHETRIRAQLAPSRFRPRSGPGVVYHTANGP